MTKRSAVHDTFTIERRYPCAPARVFKAFADPKTKRLWFKGPDEWDADPHEMDFRVGGRETSSGGPKGGVRHRFHSRYLEIVTDARIVYSYDLHLDDRRISVSLATVQLKADGASTHLIFTEQGVYLDGYDDAGSRKQGTEGLLDALGRSLTT